MVSGPFRSSVSTSPTNTLLPNNIWQTSSSLHKRKSLPGTECHSCNEFITQTYKSSSTHGPVSSTVFFLSSVVVSFLYVYIWDIAYTYSACFSVFPKPFVCMKWSMSCKAVRVLLSSDIINKIGVCMRPDEANKKKSHNETAPLRYINKGKMGDLASRLFIWRFTYPCFIDIMGYTTSDVK
jgi:hypothetical protein